MKTHIYELWNAETLTVKRKLFSFNGEIDRKNTCAVIKDKLQEYYGKEISYVGFNSWLVKADRITNIGEGKQLEYRNSSIYGGTNKCEISPLEFADGEKGPCIGFETLCEGYVISTGKNLTSIFGITEDMAYIEKVVNRKTGSSIKGRDIMNCKKFKSMKEVRKYIEKYAHILNGFVKSYGYQFGVEKLQEPDAPELEEVAELLNEINATGNEPVEAIPSEATLENMKAEAISRMKRLNLMPTVVGNFKQGKLMFSEFGGILYDANEKCKEACTRVIERGGLPYHVIRTQTEFGDLYAVLYVSENTQEWKLERPDCNGEMVAYVYNTTDDMCSEYGDIVVTSANGGLARVS